MGRATIDVEQQRLRPPTERYLPEFGNASNVPEFSPFCRYNSILTRVREHTRTEDTQPPPRARNSCPSHSARRTDSRVYAVFAEGSADPILLRRRCSRTCKQKNRGIAKSGSRSTIRDSASIFI